MKNKKILILVIVLFSIIIINSILGYLNNWNAYCLAFDKNIEIDQGLNSGIKYIAIDIDSISEINEKDKTKILDYFKKHNIEVIDESFESLEKKGMVKDGTIDGLLLSIERKVDVLSTCVIIESSKFRSGIGAIGVRVILINILGKWIVVKSGMAWIS